MLANRRDFLKAAAVGTGALALTPTPRRVDAAPRSLRILVLGGTGFIGPYQVRYAAARGHKVTVFNRGRRQADLPDTVEHLQGDRNNDLKSLEGRAWDVVIDNPTTLPSWVRLSGQLLKDSCNQYIFISTVSVYADTSKVGMDETTRVEAYKGDKDPLAVTPEDVSQGSDQLYGALKALSEREAQKWFPNRATIIRPGLIVGPGDTSGRFTYWPVRVDRGGEVLAPGTPYDPTQIIDARDLSEWTIRMAEQGDIGVYNATGPEKPRPMGQMLHEIRQAVGSQARFTWVDQDFLRRHGVREWVDVPAWMPPRPATAGFATMSVARARAKGLTYRPLGVTAKDTLLWVKARAADLQQALRAGLEAEKEAEVLKAWHAARH